MYRLTVYFVVILALYTGLAQCKPFCQCGIFNHCCLPSIPAYQIQNYLYSPPPIPSSLCPVIHSCDRFNPVGLRPCSHAGNCLATEICCFDPCYGNPTCQLRTDQHTIFDVEKCPVITSCKEYERTKTKEATECTSDKDCLRKEKCCTNPCESFKTCQEF